MKLRAAAIALTVLVLACPACAAQAASQPSDLAKLIPDLTGPKGVSTGIQWLLAITFFSLAPAILVMVTCFTRVIVVLGLLRQALATQSMPPNQVLFGLAVFMTLVVMAPVYNDVYRQAVDPYLAGKMGGPEAFAAGQGRVRDFLIRQMEAAGNTDDVYLFLGDQAGGAGKALTWGDVPTVALIPAFVVSELKVAFTIGFRIFLPFLVIDMLVASVLVSMGMLMVPPVLISLPFKLLLFVLADGWRLVIGTLMKSFG